MPGQKQQVVTKQGLQPAVSVSHASDFILIKNFVEFKFICIQHEKLGNWKAIFERSHNFLFCQTFQVWFGWPRRLFRNSTMCG